MAFNRDRNQGGGGRSFGGGGGRFDNRRQDRGPVQMHPATCSNCGKACEVPFKPTGAKPVLCNDCFRASGGPDRRDDRGGRGFDRPRFDKPRFEPRGNDRPTPPPPPPHKEFEAINHKLDKILGILMATTEAEVPAKTKKEIGEVMAEAPLEATASIEKKKKATKKKAEKKEEAPVVVEETAVVEEVTPEPTE